jgi:chromosome partitioning protein
VPLSGAGVERRLTVPCYGVLSPGKISKEVAGLKKVLVAMNEKGGVGKTTILLHLVYWALKQGLRVLAVDLDPQGNFSLSLTGDYDLPTQPGGSEALFSSGAINPRVLSDKLHLLHGHQGLETVERTTDLDAVISRPSPFEALDYDVVLIDTAPSVGLRQLAPLFWAQTVLIPLEPDEYGINGLGRTIEAVELAANSNPNLQAFAVINRFIRGSYQKRNVLALETQIREEEETGSRLKLLQPYLFSRVHVAEAIALHIPVWDLKATRTQWTDFAETVYDL